MNHTFQRPTPHTVNISRHIHRLLALLVSLLGLGAFVANAQLARPTPPGKITFQGFLTDANGLPLGNSGPINTNVIFRIYSAATGGNLKWSEQQTVTVDAGHFSVLLGEGSAYPNEPHTNELISVFGGADASERYMDITVGTTVIAPRLQFLAAPYALLAQNANDVVDPNGYPVLQGSDANKVTISKAGVVGITLDGGGIVTASKFVGDGSLLTGLSGAAISSALSASVIPNIDASLITSGTLNDARLNSDVAILNTALAGGLFARGGAPGGNGANHNGYAFLGNGGDNDSGMYSDGDGQLFFTSNSAEKMRLNGNGLGIGTTPQTALTVYGFHSGANNNTAVFYNSNIGPNASHIHWGPTGDWYIRSASGSGAVIIQDTGGNVGIGGGASVPLQVHGYAYYGLYNSPDGFNNNSGFNGCCGLGTVAGNVFPLSILTDQWIGAEGFVANSDRRIKDIVGSSDTRNDLELIKQLRVTDYRMLDSVVEGSTLRKGFIAQEVLAVIPEAVRSQTNCIPDIYSPATSLKYDKERHALTITLPKNHELKAGEVVRLFLDRSSKELPVASVISTNTFEVGSIDTEPSKAFVYGRQVDDFLSVQYDRIFTTGIGAIQELSRKVDEHAQDGIRIAELEKKAARVDALEKEIAELKKLVSAITIQKTTEREAAQVAPSSRTGIASH
jgi:hypothetical protein